MKFELIHGRELKKGDRYIRLAGRPTEIHGKHGSGEFEMSYIDLENFPGWEDGEMVVRECRSEVNVRDYKELHAYVEKALRRKEAECVRLCSQLESFHETFTQVHEHIVAADRLICCREIGGA